MITAAPRGSTTGGAVTVRSPDDGARSRRTHRARRARVLIAILAAALAVVCAPYVTGLLGAVVLYVMCAPVHRRLAPHIGPRSAAALLATAAALLLVAPVVGIVVAALHQAPGALEQIAASDAVARASGLRIGPVDLGAQIARAGDSAVAWLSSRAFDAAGSVTRALLNLLIALVGLYYLLPSAGALWAQIVPLVPFSSAGTEALRERFVLVTEATLLGILATALSQGIVVGVAFWAVGLPNALVWGVVTGAVSVLPILGASLVWLPGVVVLAFDARYGAATALALVGLVVASNVDNLVLAAVYRRVSKIHPMATIVGIFAGIDMLGPVGLLLGPLAITYTLELVKLYRGEYGEG